jgi:hypothetical protein
MREDGWQFYDVMVAVQKLQEQHTDEVAAHYLLVARNALDAAAARIEEIAAKDAE